MQKNELLQGTLDMLVLTTLKREPQHGFGMAEKNSRLSDEALKGQSSSAFAFADADPQFYEGDGRL